MRRFLAALPLLAGCFETEELLFGPAAIALSASSRSFTAAEGGADPADQSVLLTNTGGAPLVWTAARSNLWFTVTPSSGTLAPGASVLLAIHVDADFQLQAWEGATSTVSAPSARRAHSAAFVDGQMIIWRGSSAAAPDSQLPVGGRYDPVSDTWLGTTSTGSMPTERHLHTAVSTGSEMLVWGGWKFATGFFNGGGRYSPDAWSGALSSAGAPGPREGHSAVWTGTRMIVHGGWSGSAQLATGGLYDPVNDQWTGTTSTVGATPRDEHVAVWTGNRMIVWGGRGALNQDTGLIYDPAGDAWTGATAPAGGLLSGRWTAAAVWTGREMVIWGGRDAGGPLNTGARYSPATDTWLGALPTIGAPTARWSHKAVWTGTRMIVWGGDTAGGSVDTGAIWRPPIPALGDHSETLTITAPGLTPVVVNVNLTVTP